MAWSRRDVLRAGAVGLGAGLIGGREVLADPPPKKVLEVFCIGAMDPRHHLFGMCEVTQGGVAWPARLRAAPSDATPFPFAAGNPVLRVGGLNFGRAAWPLLPMAHRIRVVGMRHDIGAHPPAQELAQSGTRTGRPGQAGLAARVHAAQGWAGLVVSEDFPAMTGALAAAGVGLAHAPYFLAIPAANGLAVPGAGLAAPDPFSVAGLTRPRVSAADDAGSAYWAAADRSLTSASVGRVRSRPFDELRAARDVVLRGQADADAQRAFATILGSSGGAMDPRRAYLAGQVEGNPWVYRSLVALRESATISNVTVGVGSFDTHYLGQLTSWDQQTRSLWAVTQAIAEFDRAFPGHGILIVINTEFGRMHEAGGLGSGHYTDGYGAVVLHPTALSGDRYLGVTTTGSLPAGAFGPAYLRNAIEAYMGLDPVEYDGSDYGDGARLSAHGQVFAVDGTLPAPPVLPTGAAAGGAACPS